LNKHVKGRKNLAPVDLDLGPDAVVPGFWRIKQEIHLGPRRPGQTRFQRMHVGEAGSADLVVTFRNTHAWKRDGVFGANVVVRGADGAQVDAAVTRLAKEFGL